MARHVMILLWTNPLQITNLLQFTEGTQFRRLDRNSGNLYSYPFTCRSPLMYFTKLRLQPCFHHKNPLALNSLVFFVHSFLIISSDATNTKNSHYSYNTCHQVFSIEWYSTLTLPPSLPPPHKN